MKLLRKAGVTSEIWQIFIQDSSSATGAGLAGLTNASSGLTAYYHRDTDTTATVISLASMTVGTFTSSGFKEIDATNMPGWYQFCPPNAALAASAKSCAFHLKGATNMAPLPIECQLVAFDPDTTAAGGIPVVGTGTNNFKSDSSANVTFANTSIATVTTVTNQLTAAAIATGVWQDATAGDFTTASSIGKALYTGNFAPGAASGLAIVGSAMSLAANQHVIVDSGTVTTLTNLPAITANWLTAAGIAAGALNGKGDWLLSSSYTAPPTAAQNAVALLQYDMSTIAAEASFSVQNALRKLRNTWAISGNTLTVKKEDGTTTAYTQTLTATAGADPITAITD